MTTTTNLAEFGNREKKMAADLLNAMQKQGLPADFYDSEVTIMMNKNSGNVFLTNSECQVAMMNGDKLESFYSTPYEGREGFYDDLMQEYKDMNKEDKEYMREIKKGRG